MNQPPETNPPNIRTIPPPVSSGQRRGNSLGVEMAQQAEAMREAVANNWLATKLWALAKTFTAYLLPRLEFLEGETIQLEIRQAPYRDAVPQLVLRLWWLILTCSLTLMLLVGYLAIQAKNSPFLAMIGLLPLVTIAWALYEKLQYEQWRLILTDRRTIIYMPDPRSWWRVDTVSLGAKKIAVVDTNFSRSAWWGMFQTWTGARDLVISISGYAFKEGRAEVQGGLTIPDVMPEDIRKLEEKVFK